VCCSICMLETVEGIRCVLKLLEVVLEVLEVLELEGCAMCRFACWKPWPSGQIPASGYSPFVLSAHMVSLPGLPLSCHRNDGEGTHQLLLQVALLNCPGSG